MTKYTQTIRRDLIVDTWKKYKATIKMSDLAEIFGVKIDTIYKILKRNYYKNNK